jgi:phosphoenolpyruvate synthase/pyruvate phosphate dikinase
MIYIISRRARAKPRLVGPKAWNLFRLRSSFRVPEFAVVSTKAYQDAKQGKDIEQVKEEAARMLGRFLKKGKVAIRSSCTAEDLPGVSFAGMYSTTLNIANVDDGIRAIVRVWNSVDSPRVDEYRKKMGIAAGDTAVIIQHQLSSEVSGVMVTQSPFSISEVLIECCEGLGDKLVSGKITPTRYRIRNERTIEHRGKDILSERQRLDLVKMGKKIEKFFKSPQDVEWAIQNGRLYILQSRPVFVYATGPRKKGIVWCNANVRETIPDPVSPMTWSMFDTSFFPGIMIDVFGFPIDEERYRKFRPVEMLSGRLYWNMNNTLAYGQAIGPLLEFIGGDRAVDPQMAAAFEAVDVDNLPRILPTWRMFIFSARALARLIYYLMLGFVRYGWMSRKIANANDELESYCTDFTPSEDLTVATDKIRNWMRVVLKKFARRYFGGIFLGAFYLALLGGLLSVRMGKKGEALARKTIIGIIDKTGEMAISINRLASLARRKLKVVNVTNLKRIYKQDTEFQASIDEFMKDFGHRGPAEFDAASLNWREDHDLLYRVIAAARDSHEYSVDRAPVVRAALASARPYERFILKAFMPRLEVLIPLRENGKHFYLKATAKTKDQLLMIGERLVKRGYIGGPRDVFFLTLRDLEGIRDAGHTKKEVVELINQRKKQWHEYRRAEVPDIIYESGERVTAKVQESNVLCGEPLSSGKVKAKARIITDFSQIHRLKQGEILITHHADPGWTPLFTIASGLIVEVGGVICHAAMVARELGMPALSITGATSLILDGSIIELDADTGKAILS